MRALLVALIALIAATAAKPVVDDAVPPAAEWKPTLAEVMAEVAASDTECGRVQVSSVSVCAAAQSFVANKTGEAVMGGTTAASGAWPWTVAFYSSNWMGGWDFHAAGAIINKYWVLTSWAAANQGCKISNYRVRAGTTNQATNGGKFIQVADFWHIVDSDLAFVKLGTPLTFNNYVQPICLPNSDAGVYTPGNHAMFATWGGDSFHIKDDSLEQACLPFVDSNICSNKYGKDYNAAKELCAGGEGKTTCSYDEGGPLMQQKNGKWYLYGISANHGGSSCNSASAFTRVSSYCSSYLSYAGVSCID